ncbi:MAG: PorV/PorQ family protein [Ignavibacteriales bacterium]|nr:PorV/PorQ family protein [Ignavibacteriales bacterium]
MNKKFFQVIVVMLIVGNISYSQIVKKGQVGFRFLENPVSAEVMGRGGVGITSTLNANGIFWNPALLGWTDHSVDLSLNHTRGIADINYSAIAAALHVGNFGVLGFSLLAMDYGTFYETHRAANEQGYVETGTFSPAAFAVGLAFSQKVTDRFSYGVHIKYVYQNLGDAYVSTKGTSLTDSALTLEKRSYESSKFNTLPIAMDVGAYYDFLYNGIRFAAVLQNISREFRYESVDFPMPFAVSFGVTVQPLNFFYEESKEHNFILSFESRHPRDFGEKIKLGGEYHFKDLFVARIGYQQNYDERGLTFGAGFKYDVSNVPLRFDYAYEPFGLFGGRHYLSLGISY